jgi:hypothetical protein
MTDRKCFGLGSKPARFRNQVFRPWFDPANWKALDTDDESFGEFYIEIVCANTVEFPFCDHSYCYKFIKDFQSQYGILKSGTQRLFSINVFKFSFA